MLQVTDKQGNSYKLQINEMACTFIPLSLYVGNKLFPQKPMVHKSKGYLFWLAAKQRISYFSINKAIVSFQTTKIKKV